MDLERLLALSQQQVRQTKQMMPPRGFLQLVDGEHVLSHIVPFSKDIENEFPISFANIPSKFRVWGELIDLNITPTGKIEELVKVQVSDGKLFTILHHLLSHGPVIQAPNFHIVTPYFKYINATINETGQVKVDLCWSYQIWVQESLYFNTTMKTLGFIRSLSDYIFSPELTEYEISEVTVWSKPTLATFYSTITQNTAKIANNEVKTRVIPGIAKTLLPFQSQTLDWMLQQEGVEFLSEGLSTIEIDPNMSSNELSETLDKFTPGWSKVNFMNGLGDGKEVWFNSINGGVITTETFYSRHKSLPPAKAFLCEEMGLGKTLEVITLVHSNPRTNISLEAKRDPFDFTRIVTESKTTLILCPETIISQWVDEVECSSTELSVMVYKGVMAMEEDDPTLTPKAISSILSQFDIVLISYNILAKELDRAVFKPTERPQRSASGSDHQRIDYSSPLMLLEFHRLILDEAQLATISMSKVAKFSRIIPRIHTWCVSGTIIRKNLQDLLCLLKSQRLYPLDILNNKDWDQIMPRNLFDRMVKSRCLRHTKQMVGDQVRLPHQRRMLLRSPFSNIEWDNYSNLYNRFLQQVGLNEMGEPAIEGFDLDKSRIGMRKWSTWLRMVCNHAMMLKNDSLTKGEDIKRSNDDDIDLNMGSLDNVLKDLVKNTEMEIYHHDSNMLRDELTIGKIWEFLRDPEKSRLIFESIIKKLHARVELFNKRAQESKDTDKTIWHNRMLRMHDLLHQAYFMLASSHYQHYKPMWPIPDTFDALYDKINEVATTEDETVDVEKLTDEERVHYEKENQYYSKADELINVILEFPLAKTRDAISKMKDEFDQLEKYRPEPEEQSQEDEIDAPVNIPMEEEEQSEEEDVPVVKKEDEDSPPEDLYMMCELVSNDLVEELTLPKPSLQSQFTTERALTTIKQLDAQANVINSWFTRLVDLQSVHVTRGDEELTGSEYANSLALQEESQALIDQLPLILADRENAITRSEIGVPKPAPTTDEPDDKDWVREKKKRKGAQQKTAPANAVKKRKFEEEEPTQSEQFLLLDKLRKRVRPEAVDYPRHSMKMSLLELTDEAQSTSASILSSEAVRVGKSQLDECVKKLKTELNAQVKRLRLMKTKYLTIINDTFNAKIAYYKALQSRSDELVKYQPQFSDKLSPVNVASAEIDSTKLSILAHESRVRMNKARLNYLHSLEDPQENDNQCVICRYNILVGSLTPCGHKYCRECLGEWMKNKKICPVCQKPLNKKELYNFVASKGGLRGDLVTDATKKKNIKVEANEAEELGDLTEELNILKNRKIFEKDLNIVYSSMDNETLIRIGEISLGKSYGTKIDMIIKQVKYLRMIEPDAQILIFSQWNKFLNILARAMKSENIVYKSWTEKNLSMSNRGKRGRPLDKVEESRPKNNKLDYDIKEFKQNPQFACFLLNTVAQAAGLTFTNASHVFLCEPLVNLSFELQAVSRIHRIGQQRQTTVWNFVIEGTIEESIAYLGTRKRLLASEERSGEPIVDENALEANELTQVNAGDKREGETIDDSDLWASFFAAREANTFQNVYKYNNNT